MIEFEYILYKKVFKTHIFLHVVHLLRMFVEDVFPDELWTFELLARKWTVELSWSLFFCVHLHKLFNCLRKKRL